MKEVMQMRMYRKYETIKTWGNHIDPEISAEEYINSKKSWKYVEKSVFTNGTRIVVHS